MAAAVVAKVDVVKVSIVVRVAKAAAVVVVVVVVTSSRRDSTRLGLFDSMLIFVISRYDFCLFFKAVRF